MIAQLIVRVRVHQGTQRPAVHDKPAHKGPELMWSEKRHFEHPGGMGAIGRCVDGVDSEFGDYFTLSAFVKSLVVMSVQCVHSRRMRVQRSLA